MVLTYKQNKFCENVALKGMNYSDSFRDAYDCINMKDKSINRKAYELIEDGKITARIKELKAGLEAKTIKEIVYTRSQSFKVFDDNILLLKQKLEEIRASEELSEKDKLHLIDKFLKNIKEQEEQKAKLWSLFVDKKEIKVQSLEDLLDELE